MQKEIAIKDLKFLKEIRNRVIKGYSGNDPSQIEYAVEMVNDWIEEIENDFNIERSQRIELHQHEGIKL